MGLSHFEAACSFAGTGNIAIPLLDLITCFTVARMPAASSSRLVLRINRMLNQKTEGSVYAGSVPGLHDSEHTSRYWLLYGQTDLAGFSKCA